MSKKQLSQQNLTILVLGTGGTIAGLGGETYRAGQLAIDALLPNSIHRLVAEQIAQIDSKDMSFAVWQRLYFRLTDAMADETVDAVVITHGTDTLEETAYFLSRTLTTTKPIILTGAMRPADSPDSDGSENLAQALDAAAKLVSLSKAGVWVAFAKQLLLGGSVQKVHPTRVDAFQSFDKSAPPNDLFLGQPMLVQKAISVPAELWPRVDIVLNYAGASGHLVDSLIDSSVSGIVVAGTGNGTVSNALQAALQKACEAGIAVRLTTRCLQGDVVKKSSHSFPVVALPAPHARVALILELLSR
jgi:L-asparaginase